MASSLCGVQAEGVGSACPDPPCRPSAEGQEQQPASLAAEECSPTLLRRRHPHRKPTTECTKQDLGAFRFQLWKQTVETTMDLMVDGQHQREQRMETAEPTETSLDDLASHQTTRALAEAKVWSTEDFSSVKTLGEGGFGVVHLAQLKGSQEFYALKQIRKSGYKRKNHRERAFSERDILAEQHNHWFVRLFATFQDAEHVYMVMEFLPGGDLLGRLIELGKFSEDATRFYTAELLEAVDAVHRCGFVHRDVKPDNAVLDARGHLKLLDFGLCRQGLDPDGAFVGASAGGEGDARRRKKSVVGTPQYLAPEAFKGDYGQAADLWSIGIIAFECLVGRVPFEAPEVQVIKQKVECHDQPCSLRQADGTMMTVKEGYFAAQLAMVRDRAALSPSAERFLKRMVCDQRRRLTAGAARQEPFFMGIDFRNLHEQVPPFVPRLSGPSDTSYFESFPCYVLPKPKGDQLPDARLEWTGYDFDVATATAS